MTTPYELITKEKLYAIIDTFYQYVEKDNRINHLFPGDFKETARKQKQFLTQFLGGPMLYSDEHGHPMMRARHMHFKIGQLEKEAWLENMTKAIDAHQLESELRQYLLERLTLTAEHMVNQYDE